METMPIQERFVSIQGEGILAGTPSSFIRVAGCNLRCAWCDSPATSWQPRGEPTPLDILVEFCGRGPRHVVLTGGEPLLFPAMATLSRELTTRGHHVTVETAGTVQLPGLSCDLLSLSPKLSHSTPRHRAPDWASRHDQRRWNPAVLRTLMTTFPWQLKFVVRAHDLETLQTDLEEITTMVDELGDLPIPPEKILLMPECTDRDRLSADYARLVPVCRATGYRLGQRLHIDIFGHTPGT